MSYNSLFGLGTHSEDANLEGWWLLDETTGTTATDSSSNANDLTINGMGANPTTTTGPNSWLTSAFDFDGSDDYLQSAGAIPSSAPTALCFLAFAKFNATSSFPTIISLCDATGGGTAQHKVAIVGDNTDHIGGQVQSNAGNVSAFNSAAFSASQWYAVGVNATRSGSDWDVDLYVDGSLVASASGTLSLDAFTNLIIGATKRQNGALTGLAPTSIANPANLSRVLTLAEHVEFGAGPEPLNTVQPSTPSGTQTEGQTLTANDGSWDSQSNASIGGLNLTYQWVRANDGAGSGAADIGSATSTTYVLQAADVGKFISCRIAASNDGGNDSAEDTTSTYTGTIAASGGGTTPKGVFGLPLHGPFGGPI